MCLLNAVRAPLFEGGERRFEWVLIGLVITLLVGGHEVKKHKKHTQL